MNSLYVIFKHGDLGGETSQEVSEPIGYVTSHEAFKELMKTLIEQRKFLSYGFEFYVDKDTISIDVVDPKNIQSNGFRFVAKPVYEIDLALISIS